MSSSRRSSASHTVDATPGVIRRHDDIEDKLVVAVDDRQWDLEAITAAVAFRESGWDAEIILPI